MPECWASAGFRTVFLFGRPAADVRGAAGGRMPAADGRTLEPDLSPPRPRGFAAGAGRFVDFQSDTSGHPPGARSAPRRRHGKRFGRRSVLPLAVPHGVAASVKCRKSCSCFCREQSRQSEGIAVAMARVANAVIGKKNKTWCVYFMLAATPGRSRRAVRLYSPWAAAVC